MPRVSQKNKKFIQSACHVIRKMWLSVPCQRKCTVSWPIGVFLFFFLQGRNPTKKFHRGKNQKWILER